LRNEFIYQVEGSYSQMTRQEVKKRLEALLEVLPADKAELVLEFAASLGRELQSSSKESALGDELSAWEQALASAEDYWFSLPEAERRKYSGQMVAVLENKIVGADRDGQTLRQKVGMNYPRQPVLYIDGEATREPALIVRL
jgi:hypothetical protein